MSISIVAIDGPAGVGKTTAAKNVAGRLAIPYLNTGAMFRFLALKLGKQGMEMSDAELALKCGSLHFSLRGSGEKTELLCNGQSAGPELYTEETGTLASALAARQSVRDCLRVAQQELGRSCSLTVEGRDMGTVVFPQAAYKFFLDAKPEIRAMRRWQEMQQAGRNVSLEEILESIKKRDYQDRNRAIAPLKPARDAFLIDTSWLTHAEVTAKILEIIKAGGGI